jgi:HPt (histidine-containing phosphotransfer) domain-containing protein
MSENEIRFEELPLVEVVAVERLKEWGGNDLARKMVELFLSSTPERMAQIREGISSQDPETAERGAHSLKSSAGNVGGVRLQRLAEKAEALADDEKLGSLVELMPLVEEAYSETRDALQNLLEGMEE